MQLLTKYFLVLLIGLLSVEAYGQTSTSPKKFVVVLDAGHGGKDYGNSHNGFIEKNIALDVVLKAGKILEKHKDIKVLYTRKTDVFISLMGRAQKANLNHADLFVSVHCNSYKGTTAHGTETFVLGSWDNDRNLKIAMKENKVIYLEKDYKKTYNGFDPEDPSSYIGMTVLQEAFQDQSIMLADDIQKEYHNELHRYDRGVKRAGFLVIRETYMPSVLTEIGFLTNKAEGRYLNSTHGQKEIATAIADGIIKYKNSLNRNSEQVSATDRAAARSGGIVDPAKNIIFRVQIAAGSTPLETAPYNFNGLKGVARKKEGEYYKYYLGKTKDYLKIQTLKRKAIDKGYLKAYIVAFKNGKKIDVEEALKDKTD